METSQTSVTDSDSLLSEIMTELEHLPPERLLDALYMLRAIMRRPLPAIDPLDMLRFQCYGKG